MADAPHPELGRRLFRACDGNPDVPPLNYGRLRWFVDKLEEEGISVTAETIRKWFAGDSYPRPKAMTALAKVLKVDLAWLSTGKSSEFSESQRRQHNAVAGGAVNVVAGFIQMDGGHPAFPADDDSEATEKQVNLYAIIKGAKYNFHILGSIGEETDRRFIVPYGALETIVLGVVPSGRFAVKIYELDQEIVEKVGVRKSNGFEVRLADHPWREIPSFAERI